MAAHIEPRTLFNAHLPDIHTLLIENLGVKVTIVLCRDDMSGCLASDLDSLFISEVECFVTHCGVPYEAIQEITIRFLRLT